MFAGISQPQVSSLANDILNMDSEIDISVAMPPQGTSISDGQAAFPFYVYPIAGLRKLDEKVPILKASKQNKSKSEGAGVLMKLILPFAGIIALAVIIFIALTLVKNSKQEELRKLNNYINDPEVVAQVAEYDAMYENMGEIGSVQGGADLLNEDIASYPSPDSSVNAKILMAAAAHDVDVRFNTYSASTGVFSITASSPIVDDINMFISDLMSLDVFYSVDYTGYNLVTNDDDDSIWQINVVCTLAGSESEPALEADAASETEGEVE